MNAKKRRRLAFAAALVLAGAGGAALAVTALRNNIQYFNSPSDIAARHVAPGVFFRVGGLVKKGSVDHEKNGEVRFVVTDGKSGVPVEYKGMLPDLFREGQGVIAEGTLGADGTFTAREVLAKHDENYMPPEVAKALKESGRWNEGRK
jgi:cytochrome c-type biogenesis protein CcmE